MLPTSYTLYRKLVVIALIMVVQASLLYAFYYYQYNITNFRFSFIPKIYLPIYANSIKNLFVHGRFQPVVEEKEALATTYAQSIPIILYHGVMESPTGNNEGANVSIDTFREQMFTLKRAGYNTITMAEFTKFTLTGEKVPAKSILIQFDDGRKDSYYPVDPILEKLDYNAVMFAISKYNIGKGNDFYLSTREMKQMIETGRWEIESHSKDAHDLFPIDQFGNQGHFLANKLWLIDENRQETTEEFRERIYNDLSISKNELEREYGISIVSFAYPFSDIGQGTINFPEGKQILLDTTRSIYPFAFYEGGLLGFKVNYADRNAFLMKRLHVDPKWSGDMLVNILDILADKPLPYDDRFIKDNGWQRVYGNVSLANNKLLVDAGNTPTDRSMAVLAGSLAWQDYSARANVRLTRGSTVSVIAAYDADATTLYECQFGNGSVSIIQNDDANKTSTVLKQAKAQLTLGPINDVNIGVLTKGTTLSCTINNAVVTSVSASQVLRGGFGFETIGSTLHVEHVTVDKVN